MPGQIWLSFPREYLIYLGRIIKKTKHWQARETHIHAVQHGKDNNTKPNDNFWWSIGVQIPPKMEGAGVYLQLFCASEELYQVRYFLYLVSITNLSSDRNNLNISGLIFTYLLFFFSFCMCRRTLQLAWWSCNQQRGGDQKPHPPQWTLWQQPVSDCIYLLPWWEKCNRFLPSRKGWRWKKYCCVVLFYVILINAYTTSHKFGNQEIGYFFLVLQKH